MRNESQATERVRDARAALLLTHPFFGVLSLKLKLVEYSSIGTAGVNATELRFNPAFVMGLSTAELKVSCIPRMTNIWTVCASRTKRIFLF